MDYIVITVLGFVGGCAVRVDRVRGQPRGVVERKGARREGWLSAFGNRRR